MVENILGEKYNIEETEITNRESQIIDKGMCQNITRIENKT